MRKSALVWMLAVALWGSPGVARAECAGTYTSDQLFEDIQVMTYAIQGSDAAALAATGARVESGLVCMGEPLKPQLLAAVYRMLGVYHARSDTPDRAKLWFRIARELEPTFVWDVADLSQASTTFAMYEAARAYEGWEPEPVTGMELNIPANSKLLIDGRPLTRAEATLERYHLIQQVAADGTVRASWLVEGNTLPSQLLRDAAPTLNEQKEEVAQTRQQEKQSRKQKENQVLAGGYTTDEVTTVQRERPAAKTPLMLAGVATVLAAGGVYAASVPARERFDGASTEAELYQARTMTNSLILASGGVLLLGAGVGVTGVLLDGGGGVGLTLRW